MNEPKKVKLLNIMFMTCQIYNRSRLKHILFKELKEKRGGESFNYIFNCSP